MSIVSDFLAPYERYLWMAALVVVLIGAWALVHHIEVVGENKIRAQDAKLVAAETVHKQEVENRAQELVDQRAAKLEGALVAPPPTDALNVRVCFPTAAGPELVVSGNGARSAGSGSAAPVVPGSVASKNAPARSVNIGPATEDLFAKADAEIAYWRGYYMDCVRLKICKPPVGDAANGPAYR